MTGWEMNNKQRYEMKSEILRLLTTGLACCLLAAGCGGGDGTTTPPGDPGPNPGEGGGDPDNPVTIGDAPGAFTLPGGTPFGDLRGVAASQQFVYVADASTVYCFDKNGSFVNFLAAPGVVEGVAVMPPAPDVDVPDVQNYPVANFPVVLTQPVGGLGYVFVYPPNLDLQSTREDGTNPDGFKNITLPLGGEPIVPPASNVLLVCTRTYDLAVDRFGSIFVSADIDVTCTPQLDFPRALQSFNRFQGYVLESPHIFVCPDGDPPPSTPSLSWHRFWGELPGDAEAAIGPGGVGDMGTLAFDTFFPFNRPETSFTYYCGRFNFTRDYVGVTSITYDPFGDPQYQIPTFVGNQFGVNEVIGETVGNAPGSFSQYPPTNGGQLEDPDLTNGGPSGMSVDPLTDELYVCDPGNRRIQVFDRDTHEFLRQIGDGSRGRSGSAFVAPSSIAVDFQGNLFVCDVTDLRYIPEKLADRKYGDVGGTVRRLDNDLPLPGSTVTIGNELGTLAIAATNINGQYRFENLRIGTFYMTATKFNYDSDTATIQIKPDVMVEANFNLNPRTPPTVGSYVGDVIDADSNLYLRDVVVTIVGTSLTATTDSLGHFLFTAIAPGTYQVTFAREGYETLTRDVIITSGNTTTDGLIQLVPLPL